MLAPAAAPVNPRPWRHPGDNGRMSVTNPRGSVPEAGLAEAVENLLRGELVALPTETVYGLGADATNPAAVAKIFALKGRPADHPLIVHLAPEARLDDWAVDIPEAARRLAA